MRSLSIYLNIYINENFFLLSLSLFIKNTIIGIVDIIPLTNIVNVYFDSTPLTRKENTKITYKELI
jgi:hypothetical protein